MKKRNRTLRSVLLTGAFLWTLSACGRPDADKNLITNPDETKVVVNMFTPMEKSNPNAENVARTAQEISIMEAEEKLDLRVEYRSYTAEDYKEKTRMG